MKNPTRLLWFIYIVVVAAILYLSTFSLSGCANRKVSLVKTENKQSSDSARVQTAVIHSLDTSNKQTGKQITVHDTSQYTVEITPDSGLIRVIQGNFSGHAKKITITGSDNISKYIASVTNLHKNVTTDQVNRDSLSVSKISDQTSKTKNTEVTTSWKTIIGIIAAIALVLVAIYYYLRSTGIFTVGDALKK